MTLVIGVDPRKQTHTAVAVTAGSGELVDELTAAARPKGHAELLAWARTLDRERTWASRTFGESAAGWSGSWWRAGSGCCAWRPS
jgi:hypothetical protein